MHFIQLSVLWLHALQSASQLLLTLPVNQPKGGTAWPYGFKDFHPGDGYVLLWLIYCLSACIHYMHEFG